MPALTIQTDNPPPPQPGQNSRSSSSPVRPPVSPITPTLAPARLPDLHGRDGSSSRDDGTAPRQTFTHSQPDQNGAPPPPLEPIEFGSNPDAIALRSAISVLQVQRQRAAADIQALDRIQNEAVLDPDGFLRDLAQGKVKTKDEGFGQIGDNGEDDDKDEDDGGDGEGGGPSTAAAATTRSQGKAWTSLPRPQNVVRCPPINWSQYAVVGESLDKLHNEQVLRPTQGTPAVVGTNGMYEFKGGAGKQEKHTGVAAPLAPGKDRIDRKPKGKK